MFYDLESLETYLFNIIEDYMEFGIIKSDTKSEISNLGISDISTLDLLESEKKNQSEKLSTLYTETIDEDDLITKISEIKNRLYQPQNQKKIIKNLLESYQLTCFLIAKQIFDNRN